MPRPTVYLDNASTSWPKPRRVIDEMMRFMAEDGGSPGRGGHRQAVAAERIVRDVRVKLARLIHADDPKRIIHCLNGTDALNIALKGSLREGDHVVCNQLDHNSVSRPLEALAARKFISLTRVPVSGDGCIDPDVVRKAITSATRLVTSVHASNVTGIIQPVAEIGRIAREHDLLFLVDAAQTAGVVDIDVEAMYIDLLAFPCHKSLLGTSGTGALYVGKRADVRPWREGGTGADSIYPTQPEEFPTRLEAGSPNTAGLAGLN
ncbi:MAG: aminotransferase class V-fold PLP-dependent enzyme, partial [Planctomycetota bacterium]